MEGRMNTEALIERAETATLEWNSFDEVGYGRNVERRELIEALTAELHRYKAALEEIANPDSYGGHAYLKVAQEALEPTKEKS